MKFKKELLWHLLRISLGCVFVGASYYKIVSPGAFAHQVYNFKLLPPWAINPFALTLPWLELACGLCLVFNVAPLASSFLTFAMMASFEVAILSALARGLNISCGCFKSGGSPLTWITFVRDSSFLILSGLVFWKIFQLHREEVEFHAYH